ncbi:MAG: protease modulator HflC [Lysinibacillus sp.]
MTNNKFDGDLEKFVRNLFGEKKPTPPRNHDAGGGEPPKIVPKTKKPIDYKGWTKSIIAAAVVMALLVIAIANIYIVKENEYKVVRQFGEVVKFEDTPGIHFKVPFIQSVTTLPKNLMKYDMTEEEITTFDKKRIIIDNYAVWHITNPKELISNAGNIENGKQRMEEFIYSVLRTELGRINYDDIISDEDSERGSINDNVTARVNELLATDKYGIEVVDVRIRRTDLPSDNEQAVYTRMISNRESIAQKYLSEGDANKNRIIADTDKKVTEIVANANKDAATIIAEGEQEAAQIYNKAFSKDPEFYSLYRTLESYKRTIGEDTMIIIPSDSPYARILSGYID